jgi:hypothetical protein
MKHDPKVVLYPLSREQLVFVTVWFNMTHAYSLDSHRVRVMHGMNILEELARLAGFAHAKPEDRAMVAREAIGILENEAVLQRSRFVASTQAVRALLDKTYGLSAEKGAAEGCGPLLDSHLREYPALLGEHYLGELIAGLRAALLEPDARAEPERFDEIRSLTGTLLSYLLARGQSLEGVFQLYRQVLVPVELHGPYVFANRFDLLRRIVTSPITAWRAYFAIDGIADVGSFPEQIGDIQFARELPRGVAGLRTMNRRPRRLFAVGETQAIDARAAGQRLHEQINRALDLVRFEYHHANISVSDEFAVHASEEEDDWRVLPIPKVVPNPRAAVSGDELHQFAGHVSRLVTGVRFSQEGRDRVLSAFRLYRTGADTTNFENKLVNWWTALESLAKGAGGTSKIAEAVETSVTPVPMGVSIANYLGAYREVLLEHSIELIDSADRTPIALKQLSHAQLYELLGRPGHRRQIVERLQHLPFLQMRFNQFMAWLAEPRQMSEFLKDAEQGLRWHLQRIWRARCDIVHSAGRMVNIALLCANLEAYLKSVLTALLAAFGRIPTLASPQEFFIRADHSYASARQRLAGGDARGLKSFLMELRPH